MSTRIKNRVLEEANYIINTKKTIRELSIYFKISKSTIHKDLSERLIKIDKPKYLKVRKVLNYHLQIRHINGGEKTKEKYLKIKK